MREEQDSEVVRATRYMDWHRVERALRVFAREAERLTSSGWLDEPAH